MKVKFIFPFLFLLIAADNSFSQKWIWGRSSSGNGEDEGMSVCTDAGGNAFVTGSFDGSSITFGPVILANAGNSDIFLTKYDPNGNVIWAKSAGGTGFEVANSVCTDVSGNIFICGNFSGPTLTLGATTLINASGDDIFIAKCDPSGNVLWAKSSTGPGTNEGYSVSADINGNTFITGYFGGSTITFGGITLFNAGSDDIFLVKYDPNGNVLWAKSAGGNSFDIGTSVSADAIGNVLLTGRFFNSIAFGITTLTSAGGADVFLAKYDVSGNVVWAKSAGGVNNDMGFSVSAIPGGNISITGAFYSPSITFGPTVLTNSGLCNVFVVQYDITGNVTWANSASGPDNYFGKSVSTDFSGNTYAVGLADGNTSINFGASALPLSPGVESYFIVKYDNAGNILCDSILNGGVDDLAVAADQNGHAYMAGDFGFGAGGTFIVGPDTLTPSGLENVFVSKYTCCANFTPAITGISHICKGDSAVLTASGGITYSWSTGETNSIVTVTLSANTTYTVTAINNSGCSGDTTFTVTVNPNPTASAGANITVYQGQNTTLNASGGIIYSWSNGATGSMITVTPQVATVYCVTVTDTNNCRDTACIKIFIESPCDTAGDFFFPNAFSPDGDGENDFLKIYYGNLSCIKTLHLIIYERWGEKVYETNDPAFQWDGAYKSALIGNQKAGTEVFVYYMDVEFTDGNKISKKGNISLAR